MNEIIRKAICVGLGAAMLTKEKMEKVIKNLVKGGKISAKEGKDIIAALVKEAYQEKKRIEQLIKTEKSKLMKEAQTIVNKEVKILKGKIKKLEKKAPGKKKSGKKKKK